MLVSDTPYRGVYINGQLGGVNGGNSCTILENVLVQNGSNFMKHELPDKYTLPPGSYGYVLGGNGIELENNSRISNSVNVFELVMTTSGTSRIKQVYSMNEYMNFMDGYLRSPLVCSNPEDVNIVGDLSKIRVGSDEHVGVRLKFESINPATTVQRYFGHVPNSVRAKGSKSFSQKLNFGKLYQDWDGIEVWERFGTLGMHSTPVRGIIWNIDIVYSMTNVTKSGFVIDKTGCRNRNSEKPECTKHVGSGYINVQDVNNGSHRVNLARFVTDAIFETSPNNPKTVYIKKLLDDISDKDDRELLYRLWRNVAFGETFESSGRLEKLDHITSHIKDKRRYYTLGLLGLTAVGIVGASTALPIVAVSTLFDPTFSPSAIYRRCKRGL